MKYNRPHSTAAWGLMAKDWEQGSTIIDCPLERLKRAQGAIRLCRAWRRALLRFDNIRYVTATHIGEWARDKFFRYALCPRKRRTVSMGPGAAGQAHLLPMDRRQCRRPDHNNARRDPAVNECAARLRQTDQEGARPLQASTRSRSASI